jgi:hypothetical protein
MNEEGVVSHLRSVIWGASCCFLIVVGANIMGEIAFKKKRVSSRIPPPLIG